MLLALHMHAFTNCISLGAQSNSAACLRQAMSNINMDNQSPKCTMWTQDSLCSFGEKRSATLTCVCAKRSCYTIHLHAQRCMPEGLSLMIL